MTEPLARVLALYLPQFHPIPENDAWWGPGFTEWTNVAKARPMFRGHHQPRLPADLGFYDLRAPEVREHQAQLARAAGIESFCYWHYWFGDGRRILERPFDEVLASGAPDFPFCLAWANQTWTGIWHGAPNATLIEQSYPGRADEEAHFRWALKAFEDPRYTRVDGKPLFVIFRPNDLPSSAAMLDHWRELALKAGLPGLYFVAISHVHARGVDRYRDKILEPFDAVTICGPQDYLETHGWAAGRSLSRRLAELNVGRLNRFKPPSLRRPTRIDFADVVAHAFEDLPDDPRFLLSVLAGWDNTPRSGERGLVYEGMTVELFKAYLEKAVNLLKARPPEHRILFLKSWNEWAEGNHVEPDAQYGHGLLDALREVLLPSASRAGAT
ncbi:glycoside hydrolase family 99-like domain-containing protein [Phenylobacterium sp.]|uniref:glycosyltransferase WbsX family protein n=1 Tax=Phenylobacterium sp. TaxID=1871053 RepID=UPI0035625015